MSRGYRISARRAAINWTVERDTVSAEETRRLAVQLLPILGEAEMGALLRAELEAAGWADGRTTVAGADVRLSDDGRAIEVTREASREINARATSRAAAKLNLDAQRDAANARLEAELSRQLAAIEEALHDTLNTAVQRVYVTALQQKAARLGEVIGVVDQGVDGAVDLTIKIKV